jgi:hypothetical protein
MNWRERSASTDDTCPIYMHRSPHDQALGKKEVQVTALIVSQACIPSPNYCTALGQLLAIPLALPRHVGAIGRKGKDNSTSASGNKQRHCLGDMYSEKANCSPRNALAPAASTSGGRVMRHFVKVLLYATPRCEQAVSCGEARDLICLAPLDIKREPLICFQRDRGCQCRLCCRRSIQAFAMLTGRVGGVAAAILVGLGPFALPGLPVISPIDLLTRLLCWRTTTRIDQIDHPRCLTLRLRSTVCLRPSFHNVWNVT